MSILVTGGAGFIGSHTVVELLNAGKDVVIVDNFVNSKPVVLDRIREITGKDFKFYCADLCDKSALEVVFASEKIDSCIHFAGLKAVGESCKIPLRYYQNNLISTLNLCEMLEKYNCKNIVFSSSATVYGKPASVPIKETFPTNEATNPYGETKLQIEHILKDLYKADPSWNTALLRYFNPIGAHESGKIGEDPSGIPNNLMPLIMRAANGEMTLRVFGNDYNTPDGTGVRDYIHVMDLADGHIKALSDYDKPAVHHAGRYRQAPVPVGLRQRLRDTRRNRRARLHPRRRPREGSPRGSELARQEAGTRRVQHRNRSRLLGARHR